MGKKDDSRDKQDEPEEELLTPVGPGAERPSSREDEEEPVRDASDEADEDPEEGDSERVGHVDEEAQDEHRHEKRRDQRRKRKERLKRDQTELRFLRTRNEQLERRFSEQDGRITQSEVAAIDGRIAQLEDQIRQAEDIHATALEKGSGTDAVEALKLRDQFRDALGELKGARQNTLTQAQQRQRAQPTVDPAIQERAQQWASENSDWFDPRMSDEVSVVAYAIEQSLFREGRIDPRSDAYYKELDRRLKKRLPDVFNDDEESEEDRDSGSDSRSDREPRKNGSNRRPTGPTFRTGGRERPLRKGEVYVDADRRKAMEEMGVWEDEVLRERYLKSFQRYDREQGRKRN